MKLYTEEQVKQILEELQKAFLPKNIECDGAHCIGCWKDVVRTTIQMANSFTPIQLPSDEEIESNAVITYRGKDLNEQRANNNLIIAFEVGAEWMRDKIKGGNK